MSKQLKKGGEFLVAETDCTEIFTFPEFFKLAGFNDLIGWVVGFGEVRVCRFTAGADRKFPTSCFTSDRA